MKIILRKAGYLSKIERYDLDATYEQSKELSKEETMNSGLIVGYLLATHPNLKLVKVELEAAHSEIGVPLDWSATYTPENFTNRFDSVNSFLSVYDDDSFGKWRVTAEYNGVKIIFSGNRRTAIVGVLYPLEENINLVSLLQNIEKQATNIKKMNNSG